MTTTQILSCCANHKYLNKKYYEKFLWGGEAVRNYPSPRDISQIISCFSDQSSGKMNAPYAQRVAIVELNP